MKKILKKSLVLITVGIVFLLGCDRPPDPEKVLARARKFHRQGAYEKALQDHIWFHDNALKYKPSLYGVRLSFALIDWVALGEKYPDAHNALVDIRNRKTGLIQNSQGSPGLFHDVAAINHYLNDRQKTVDLYKELIHVDFDLAKQCYDLAKSDLIAFQEFQICNRMMPSPVFIVRDMRNMLKKNIEIYKSTQWADNTHLEWTIAHFLEEAEATLLVLAKNNRFAEAHRFLADAAKGIDMARIRSGLEDLRHKYAPSRDTSGRSASKPVGGNTD